MANKKEQIIYFPQAMMLHHAALGGIGKPGAQAPIKPSSMGMQKLVKMAKLEGSYIPEALMSKIYSKDNAKDIDKHFMSLPNHKLSALTPEIRIFRIDNNRRPVPFYFPVVSDYNFEGKRINLNKPFTSNAASIESFSVTYTGKNPWQASRKHLQASLTVKVDNIASIFDVPGDNRDDYAPIADLFTIRTERTSAKPSKIPGDKKSKPASMLQNADSCHIAVVLGYATHQTDVLSSQEMSMIEDNKMLVNLFYKNHNLNMNQDGSATVTVEYQGYLQAHAGDSFFELLTPPTTKAHLQRVVNSATKKEEKKDIKKIPQTEEEKKAAKTFQEEVDKISVEMVIKAFSEIFNNLFVENKVHTTTFVKAYRNQKIIQTGESSPTSSTTSSVPEAYKDFFKTKIESIAPNENVWSSITRTNFIHYVTVGDLLDSYFKKLTNDIAFTQKLFKDSLDKGTISKEIYEENNAVISKKRDKLKKLNLIFCDFTFAVKADNKNSLMKFTMNIADIPIAIDTLYTMVFDDLIVTRKGFLGIDEFLNDFMPAIIARSFGELPGADFIKDLNFSTTTFSAKPLSSSKIKEGIVKIQNLPKPTGGVSKKMVKESEEYFLFHPEPPAWTRSPGSGSKKKDLGNGIFHIRASQDRGLVKSINFSRISQPAREAYMIVRNGQMYDELRFPHNATVEMFGNNLFMPLSCVYINPETLGFGDPRSSNSAARRLGFGGYYCCQSVTTSFSGGELSTTLNLLFNCFPENESQSTLSDTMRQSIKDL